MKRVVVRTHGGLGNQLFQLLYARLCARQACATLFEVHDLRYAHRFQRCIELERFPAPPLGTRAVSAIRLPKIFSLLGLPRDHVKLRHTTYLDGYFQRVRDYDKFDDALLRDELLRLRKELNISNIPTREFGMHLRLGDFFKSEADVIEHLNDRFRHLAQDSAIVTNEEFRLCSPQIEEILAAKNATIVSTRNMSPEEVLRILASFRKVDGNDSTLLFWASVLSGMESEYRNLELRVLRERFLAVLQD